MTDCIMINLGLKNSLFNQFLFEIRDEKVQQDSMRFRRNLERLSEIMAYEISAKLNYQTRKVVTSLGETEMNLLTDYPVIASILRAGLPMHQGFLNYFDRSSNAFISAFRKYEQDGSFEIKVEYASCPDINGKTLIIVDPMLATASSMILTYKQLLQYGTPEHVHIATLIASKHGVNQVKKSLPADKMTLWVGAVDDELTAKSYIVPGLGDAGDLAYGAKED